ncbi:MAG: hypothetical protein WAN87_03880 [Thermoplasmata archaeon]
MRVPLRDRTIRRSRTVVLSLVLMLVVSAGAALPAARASYPPLPIDIGAQFVQQINAPTLAPSTSGTISFVVENALTAAVTFGVVNVSIYAFNAYPGNATAPLPGGGETPTFSNGESSLSLALPSPFAANARVTDMIAIQAPSGAPQGDFAFRISLFLIENGTPYLLESRGFFSNAAWANATTAPGGGATLNLTALGVSGVLPESAILVRANEFVLPLYVIFAIAVVLAGLGGYYAFRKGPGSKSGARNSPEVRNAPSAFGKSRINDGD